ENAIKYKQKAAVPLKIEINIKGGKQYDTIVFKDNGQGIAAQYLGKIFDKFFRVPTGDRHETKGYGLGLSYVNEVVKLHHGKIEVASELNRGSRFSINLPKKKHE